MKKFLKILVFTIIGIVVCIVGVLAFHGFFVSPTVTEKDVGPYTVAVKRFIGAYYQVGPTMTEVDTSLRDMGVVSTKGIGLYYDDPAGVPQTELRSDVGNILEGVDNQTIEKIKTKYEVKEIPQMHAVVVEYPIVSPLSYMIAPMKVYPAIAKYWKEKGYVEDPEGYGIEIYDIPGKVTTYVMSIPAKN